MEVDTANPTGAWAIASRGQAYLTLKRYDQALADLNRAIELDPAEAWAIDLNRAIELDPDDAEAIGSRGQACRLLGREEEALADFARATELDPGYKPAGD